MITENLSTLKIHKLTQAQYERARANGTLEENALYLTPDEAEDMSNYYTKAEIDAMEFITAEDIDSIWDGSTEGGDIVNITVDSVLSETSENPVQNKVITAEFNRIYASIGNILNGAS